MNQDQRAEALRAEAEILRRGAVPYRSERDVALDYLILKAADELNAQGSPPSGLVITASNWDGCAESVRVSRPFAASVWTAVARTLRLIRNES